MSFRKVVVSEPGFENFTQTESEISKMKSIDSDMRDLLHSKLPDDVKVLLYNKLVHLFGKLLNDFRNPGLSESQPPIVEKKPKKVSVPKAKKKKELKPKRKILKYRTPVSNDDDDIAFQTPQSSKESKEHTPIADESTTPKIKKNQTRIGRIVKKPVRYGFGKAFRVILYKYS